MTDTAHRPDLLVAATTEVFTAAGLSRPAARTVAESLVEADLRGVPSHGIMLVPMYVERLRAGSVTTAELGRVVHDAGAVVILDAAHALGQLTGDQAMSMAVAKAATHGVGVVCVRHGFHFGGAYRYVAAAAEHGCIGVAASNTRPLMPAPGGAVPVVGNNPLAIGVPRKNGPALILDMALSEAALGKIRIADSDGVDIPLTWATDDRGVPTTDPASALAGMLLPAGGAKGFGLALMVDVLAGVLSGGAFADQVQGLYADTTVPNDCSHFFLALDIETFGAGDQFAGRVERLLEQVLASPPAPGVDRVLIPGQREADAADATRASGIRVSGHVLDGLREAAASVGAVLPEEFR